MTPPAVFAGALAMPVLLDEFVAQVVATGLISAEEIGALVANLPAGNQSSPSEQLARELVRRNRLTAYQAKEIFSGHGKSLVLGNYLILDKLGQGGMGLVLKAEHRRMERLVALKVLSPKLVQNPDSLRRFQREVKAAARLTHPNIVTAYDADEASGTHFLVMEYVEGSDLLAQVKQHGPLPLDQALGCILQAAAGLQYAHEHGVVHRDIKPANLLLDHQGAVKILDMGLARLDTDSPQQDELTGSGQIMGTVDYMAPEQATSTKTADGRADIYSLGATFWYLLTGQPLYTGKTVVDKIVAHQSQAIPSLCAVCADVPRALDTVFGRLVAKTPEDRYQTMAEAIANLEPFRGGAAAATARPPVVEDEKLDAFLRGLGTTPTSHRHGATTSGPSPAEQRATQTKPKTAPDTAPAAGFEATLDWSAAQVDTNTDTEQKLPARRRTKPPAIRHAHAQPSPPPWWQNWKKLAACGASVAALLVVAVLLVGPKRPAADEADGDRDDPAATQTAAAQPAATQTDALRAPQAVPEPEPTRLALQWPPAERSDTQLQIDGRVHDPAQLVVPNAQDQLGIELKPGAHQVRIARRGFEPFEQTVELVEGKTSEVRPVWKPLPTVALSEPATAPVEPAAASTDPAPPVPAEDQTPPASSPAAPKPAAVAESARVPPSPDTPVPATADDAERQKRREVEAGFAAVLQPAQDLIAAWDFRGALAALDKLQPTDPELAARVQQRRDDVLHLGRFRTRMIQAINKATPPKTKFELQLRGAPGDVTKADESGLTATLTTGKIEEHPWHELSAKCVTRLTELAMDPASGGDWISVGLFALILQDVPAAERSFDKARSLGANIDPYLATLAQRAFAAAEALAAKEEFAMAEISLASIEQMYGKTPWFGENKNEFETLRAVVKAGMREAEAEELYAEAAKLFAEDDLFEVRPLVERLKAEYATTRVLGDTQRTPTFLELDKATAELGQRLTVRLDGKGDFKTIQEAVHAALPNSLIEIGDNGPYSEAVKLPKEKAGITVRGKRGCWPVITSVEPNSVVGSLLSIGAAETAVERLVLINLGAPGRTPYCIQTQDDPASVTIRKCLAWQHVDRAIRALRGDVFVVDSVILSKTEVYDSSFKNSIVANCDFSGSARMRFCVLLRGAIIGGRVSLTDCFLGAFQNANRSPGSQMDHCVTFGDVSPDIVRKDGCSNANPMFFDPTNLDYRLQPGSPCIGKASDGGDIGCRYTPEMIELCKIALELRARGVIKF
jgi:serine/threonine protein kinase